jgi:hypothetical protein
MSCWERLAEKNAHLAPAIQIGLDFATKYFKWMDDTWADNSIDTQSVDQEYSAYAFGTLAKLNTDLLKF